MKKFIVGIAVFILIVFVIDTAVGGIFSYLVTTAKGGDIGRAEYVCHKTSEDILVFGSSRATHHYNPVIIEDSLGMSVYNCGKDGNGIILLYGWYQVLKDHYNPRVILYDITPGFDLLENDNMKYLPNLRFFYNEASVDSILWSVDRTERYKMQVKSYRYNSTFLQILVDNIKPMLSDVKGYRPLYGEMDYEPAVSEVRGNYKYDSLKFYYLERLINDCKSAGTRLIFSVSPMYRNSDDEVLAPLFALCQQYDIPLLNHYVDANFNSKKQYFKDRVHLNESGADLYTKTVAGELKSILAE